MASYVHYQLLTDASYTSFCDVGDTMSCTQAYLSRYGSVAGVPVAVGGVMFFAVVLAIVGLTGAKSRENVPGYVFALSTLAPGLRPLPRVGVVRRAQGVLYPLCGHLCGRHRHLSHFRWSDHVSHEDFAHSRPSRPANARFESTGARRRARPASSGAVMAVSVFPREAAVSAQTTAAQAAAPLPAVTDEQRAQIAKWWEVQPKVEVPVPADGAKVLIVKFNDYQCPACKITFDGYTPDPAEVHRQRSGEIRHQALSARAGVQPVRAGRQSLRVVRGGRGGAHGEGQGHVR